MEKIKVSIELDPINDGITNFEELIEVEDVRGVVVSTTGKWRPISGDDIKECDNIQGVFKELENNKEKIYKKHSVMSEEDYARMEKIEQYMPEAYNKLKEAEDKECNQ